MPQKNAYLRLDTTKFIGVWIAHLQKAKEINEEPSLPIFANQVATAFREDPANADYLEQNGPDSITGKLIYGKVINKCRSINSSLKGKTGKTLPIPRGDGRPARKTVSEILETIEGATDFLK